MSKFRSVFFTFIVFFLGGGERKTITITFHKKNANINVEQDFKGNKNTACSIAQGCHTIPVPTQDKNLEVLELASYTSKVVLDISDVK